MKTSRLRIAVVLLIPLLFLFHRHADEAPNETKDLLDKYEREVGEIRAKADTAIAAKREKLLADLKTLHETLLKAGKAEEARALREQIVLLVEGVAQVAADPGTLQGFRGQNGKALYFEVTGTTNGAVWGTDTYTDDSVLAVAAVHAGILKEGEKGVVKVTIHKGEDGYTGSTRNGVTTQNWEAWVGSYKVEAAVVGKGAVFVKPDPGTVQGYRGQDGKVFYFEVTGITTGTVWGTEVYTDDSSLATAAVHAGVLKDGERGIVKVTIVKGQDSYRGTTSNGVTTQDYGAWEGSFTIDRARGLGMGGGRLETRPDPGTLTTFRGQNGKVLYFEVTGRTTGAVWGTDVYTDDSALASAAVHAGVLKDGESGVVKVIILEGKEAYQSTTRNGVTSSPWNAWSGSYQVEAVGKK